MLLLACRRFGSGVGAYPRADDQERRQAVTKIVPARTARDIQIAFAEGIASGDGAHQRDIVQNELLLQGIHGIRCLWRIPQLKWGEVTGTSS